jgi:hypothetical protein
MTNILEIKILSLDKALSSYKDTKGQLASFKQDSKNPDIYTGKSKDGYDYYIELQPRMCEVKRVKEE